MDLSVIVPLYNHENYVEEALSSMIEKEYPSNIEYLVVNDASTDKSLEVVKRIAKQHKNVRIIENKKNLGCAASINKALKLAKGKYIGINSSDDFVDKKYYSKMLSIALEQDADVVCANIATVDDVGENIVYHDVYENNLYRKVISDALKNDGSPHITEAKYLLGHWTASSSSTKIIKKELYDNYNFVGSKANDIPSIYPILASAKKIVYYPKLYKYYRSTPNSLSRSVGVDNYNSVIDSFMVAFDRLNHINDSFEIQQTLFYNNFLTYFWSVLLNVSDNIIKAKILYYFIKESTAKDNFFDKIIKNDILLNQFNENHSLELKTKENYSDLIDTLINEKEIIRINDNIELLNKENNSLLIQIEKTNNDNNLLLAQINNIRLEKRGLQKVKNKLQRDNQELLNTIDKNNNNIEDLNIFISKILNSKSMKITKPLRELNKLIKGEQNNDKDF